MRDQKVRRIMGNYGEPSGNICSDLLIEPQVTSSDLMTNTHTDTFCRLYLDLPRPKLDQTPVHHGPSPTGHLQILFTTEDLPLYCT